MNNLFKALNDKTRREILEILRLGDLSAGEISDRFNMSKPSISHHLDLLRQAELVSSKKKGQFVVYTLNIAAFEEITNWFLMFKPEAIAEKPRIRIPLSQY
ncbi:ArsR family transcriptional regulator [Lacihabitans sp. LS3-19]|uniref:autorepressor SdpR family transcription factor n=1 Tax=Lacihabitans sp. LS3-19 TaxID=2487335 RepID=UPI0020CE3BBE|nr:autorepressor SdpR family transcription factor [Lacihabitans sp. LS3-19]MCP9767704.1 ArsR family transcriptional regulator [Lacihabitans sp. LS3-19]